ncbi:hypothetical protein GGQ74_000068 [Desulfobaculum xiamenense]|uniref:Uncharacterized protein n=1 Tax=Desulfobaculum xiamenense TaxID=995050 RepID=A0A846QDG7_9BACT|nr:hypothetical protein [Desulfobaculum xiamenense]NJB66428.1 hypothetical protein [Desulfobaculum xiamenense]
MSMSNRPDAAPRPEDVQVTLRHMRHMRYCMRGVRAFFAARGWGWADFREHGRTAADFLADGDAMAVAVAHAAMAEARERWLTAWRAWCARQLPREGN